MRKYIKPILLGAVMALSISCSDDFLEESPNENVTVEDVSETGKIYPGVLNGTLRGIYETMLQVETGGLPGVHEDYGQKGYDVISDMLSGDLALAQNVYNRYSSIAQLIATNDFTFNKPNYMAWRYYYRIINSSNLVIRSLGGADAVITDANREQMGQAKALRAYGYFYLTQLYIPEYTPTSKILPIYTEANSDAQPQSTTEEVYKLMVKDLEEAIALLESYNREEKYQINKHVAKALLAYVYASRGTGTDNANARNLAEEVINEGGFPLTSKEKATGGFNSVAENPSWMWGVDITIDNGLDLVSWWGQMDYYTFSYQSFGDLKQIDLGLFNSIKDKDIRKTQFDSNTTSGSYLMPINKFYHSAKKFRGQRNIESDYIYMRIDEMYLLSAEMAAKEGLEVEAKNRLKDLLSERYEDAADYGYIDALSGQALQDEIYLQTRIEFWGEGKSFFALKRNKATLTRGSNHAYLMGESIPYNDDRLVLEIPQSEVQNNPFIN
ncbi:SusD-like starch-binding protein associating with outer membrane [Tenacibaculum gallaicum]|uniref:SusD-like starch-binding protein associating with outer membrane n=1 Tax=Tenacibaculum gallaicum TaxID=561505 RepID=A0A3E0I7D4_9FLAO|nr:RagB/SusD family nutrient uptake outer membrane protein [Tenacibaculum gallaicum]REH54653.1 SusD-like starch-binding protein associating with outer membrane [Tenacibaculum gallaicum]